MCSYLTQAVQGTGLAFIVYTEAIKNMEVSQLWSVLYFFMLLLLGVGSMLGNTAAILTPLMDSKLISSYLPKEAISGEWARHQGGGAWAAEQRLCPQDSPTPRVTAASSWESCHGALRHSGYVIHPTSGPPHHGEVRWSPQPSAKARFPNMALQALQAFREPALLSVLT